MAFFTVDAPSRRGSQINLGEMMHATGIEREHRNSLMDAGGGPAVLPLKYSFNVAC